MWSSWAWWHLYKTKEQQRKLLRKGEPVEELVKEEIDNVDVPVPVP